MIAAIKSELLGEQELMKRTNLKQTPIRVIKADLVEQGIIREVMIGKSKKYEFIPNSPPLNTQAFEALREAKLKELDSMIAYLETTGSRMKFLCDYLGDAADHAFTNCDNTKEKKIIVNSSPEWVQKLSAFRESYFPKLEVESSRSNLVNGVAASYYRLSNVGAAIHRSKYEQGGDFPDFLLKLVLKAFRKRFGQEQFDLVVYVPPTSSGDLVKNFAVKFTGVLKIPVSHNLVKIRATAAQKIFENAPLKSENVRNSFTYKEPVEIKGKSILLIDDVFDSGATIKEIGKVLTNFGAARIAPVVIARTVGGDIV